MGVSYPFDKMPAPTGDRGLSPFGWEAFKLYASCRSPLSFLLNNSPLLRNFVMLNLIRILIPRTPHCEI